MNIYLHNGKLYAHSGDLTFSDIRVSLEYLGKTENYVDIFNQPWTIDEKNLSASAPMGEDGFGCSLRKANTASSFPPIFLQANNSG